MHAAARLVCDIKPRDHVTSSLRALHWLPVKQIIEFKLCLLVHLAVNGRAPSYLQDLITPSASVPGRASLRSASNHDLVVQSFHLKLGDRTFSVAGPRAWNRLPIELKTVLDTALFKRNLKHIYLQLHIINFKLQVCDIDIVLGYRSAVGGNTDSVLLLLLLLLLQ